MPNHIVSLGDLQDLLKVYRDHFKDHDAEALKLDGSLSHKVPSSDIDELTAAIDQLNVRLGKICQQAILAVRLTPKA